MALGAVVDLAGGPVALVSAHLENRSTPDERRAAMERLLAGLDLGWFERPEAREPLFSALRLAGFDWRRCNAPDQTRGLAATAPATWPAVAGDGATLSDHELITVDLSLVADTAEPPGGVGG